MVVLGGVHYEVVLLEGLEDLDELLLRSDQWLVRAPPLALALVQAHVSAPERVRRRLVLRVLQTVAHLEDEALLLVVEDRRS